MTPDDEARELLAALRGYLEELEETGVEGLPLTVPGRREEEAVGAPVASEGRETLAAIRADLGECQRCQLGNTRTSLVFGIGNPRARLVFVGEAPGEEEDRRGEPFVGEAGELLTKIIGAMGLSRDDVYICNVLKCRPPKNRDPLPEEIETCSSFMLRQVQAIAPEAVVALGTFAAQTLLATKDPISRLRGHFHDYHGIPLMPTFHPAFLLRNAAMKRQVWDDMQQVMKLLKLPLPQPKK